MKIGKIIRIVAIVALVGLLGYGVYIGAKPTPISEKVWDTRSTAGNLDTAENYFIIYTDLMCPYCVAFENAILTNEEEFEEYIEENKVLVEVKVTDFLYEFGETKPINSRYSAEATYCAMEEGKFWDYYGTAIRTVWDTYFAVSGKSAFIEMNKLSKEYWIALGESVGLGESFRSCVENDEKLDLIIANTKKTLDSINGGMPYFKFNKFSFSGFDLSWGWDYVKAYFDKGLANK